MPIVTMLLGFAIGCVFSVTVAGIAWSVTREARILSELEYMRRFDDSVREIDGEYPTFEGDSSRVGGLEEL